VFPVRVKVGSQYPSEGHSRLLPNVSRCGSWFYAPSAGVPGLVPGHPGVLAGGRDSLARAPALPPATAMGPVSTFRFPRKGTHHFLGALLMAGDSIPAPDGDFNAWQTNFVGYVSTNTAW